jgi:hypothetical protein
MIKMKVKELIKMLETYNGESDIFVEMIPEDGKYSWQNRFYEIKGIQGRLIGKGILIKETDKFISEFEKND